MNDKTRQQIMKNRELLKGYSGADVGSYDQDLLDELLGFMPGPSAEPEYECAVYAAAVGRVRK